MYQKTPKFNLKNPSIYLRCNVTTIPNRVLTTYLSIAFRKGSPYKNYINKRIPLYWQNGLIRKWMVEYSGTFGRKNTSHRCSEINDDRLKRFGNF